MIRYELHSNVAASEQGLHRFPALADFVQTCAAKGVELRFVRQVHREEGEVNLASSRHARGVKVRGTTVRELGPEQHIRGCLAWMRAALARPERGLHAEVAQLRATHGAPLVIAQVLARKQRVFVSGPDALGWQRLTCAPDPTCRDLPEAMRASPELREEYLSRARRPTGFFAALQRLAHLEVPAGETLALVQALSTARNPSELKRLSETQIVNLGLLDELVERYQNLVEQFCALLTGEGNQGDLPPLFDLLTQGLDLTGARKRFAEYALPEQRAAIDSKRQLVHAVRIGLRQGEELQRDLFQRRLLREVVLLRARQDPRLYARVLRLPPLAPELLEGLKTPRSTFMAWWADAAATVARAPADAAAEVPTPAKQGLFELAVNLVYQGQFHKSFRDGTQPAEVVVARNLLSCFTFRAFDIGRVRTLHPGLPARGVARNLSERVPLTWGEMRSIAANLWEAMYPSAPMADALARELYGSDDQRRKERAAEEQRAFLFGAHALLGTTNYVVGQAGGEPLLRSAVLAAGRALGLRMLESRDQIRNLPAPDADTDEQVAAGHQLLMVADDSRWLPIRAQPAQLAGAYRHLAQEAVARRVRAYVARRLNFLFERHRRGLFGLLQHRLTWDQPLTLSRAQTATLLVRGGVFEEGRLREFGFEDAEKAAPASANPWLQAALDEQGTGERFAPEAVDKAVRTHLDAFRAILRDHGPAASPQTKRPPLGAALAALAADDRCDLHDPAVRTALAETREAAQLTTTLAALVGPDAEALLAERESSDALEVPLHGALAYLALLREQHPLKLSSGTLTIRLVVVAQAPAPEDAGAAARVAQGIAQRFKASQELQQVVGRLRRHDLAWRQLVLAATPVLVDQMLRETVLRLAQPGPPAPQALRAWPDAHILCLGASTHDQSRFVRVAAHPERREVFATLSELASWLLRFRRLREELGAYRELIADVLDIIAGLDLSSFDAPYISRYGEALQQLSEALSVRPEELAREDLEAIEGRARTLGAMVREFYDQERSVALRDRWMSRIAMQLRAMRPNVRLTFVDLLHEHAHPAPRARSRSEAAREGRPRAGGEDYQTFSERVRNVIGFRERLAGKRVFVMSPANPQRQLTLMLLEQLYRLKGLHTPIFADVSGCQSFVDQLQTRIPPHRLFELNALQPPPPRAAPAGAARVAKLPAAGLGRAEARP